MTPEELKANVMDAIADDYENLDSIMADLRVSTEAGDHVSAQEVCSALADLIADGLAEAFLLSAAPGVKPRPTTYDPSLARTLYYTLTERGRAGLMV